MPLSSPIRGLLLVFLVASQFSSAAPPSGGGGGGGGGANINNQVPVLVDSTGKTVGRYVGTQVLLLYNGETLPMNLANTQDGNGFATSSAWTWHEREIMYTTSNCSGQGYLYLQSNGSRLWVIANNSAAYVSSGSPTSVTVGSYFYQGACSLTSYTLPVAPITGSFSLDAYGTPPFYVK